MPHAQDLRNVVQMPRSIPVCLVEGCNRACSFCGLASIREGIGNYKYMSENVWKKLAWDISVLCPETRVEFAVQGEPMMHPNIVEIVKHFRRCLPKAQIQVTTNGRVLAKKMQERVEALFRAGLDFVVLDTYNPESPELCAEARQLEPPIIVRDFYDDLAPSGWSPWHNHKRKYRNLVCVMQDLGDRAGERANRVLDNQAGNNKLSDALKEPVPHICARPFRDLSVLYDGRIPVCCVDWGKELIVGNFMDSSLHDIWNGETFDAIRRALGNKKRAMSPCIGCDYRGTRAHLIPKYDKPKQGDELVLREALNATPENGRTPTVDEILLFQ